MEIKQNQRSIAITTFGELRMGDVFALKEDIDGSLKVKSLHMVTSSSGKAVELNTGQIHYIASNELAIKMKVHLSIDGLEAAST